MTYRNHDHEARIVERCHELGMRQLKGRMPLPEQAKELRAIERFLGEEISLPEVLKSNNKNHQDLMRFARRKP